MPAPLAHWWPPASTPCATMMSAPCLAASRAAATEPTWTTTLGVQASDDADADDADGLDLSDAMASRMVSGAPGDGANSQTAAGR